MSNQICPEIKKPTFDLVYEGCGTLRSNLVAINCFGVIVDLSSIIFSSGYTPIKFDVIDKGFFLLYYSDPYTAIMAAWFFEIKGVPTATLAGWSLLRICGPTTTNELIENLFFKRQCVSFCKYKGSFSWIAVHGIHTKDLVINSIRGKKWSIIESLNNRNFLDVIEMMEMFSIKEITDIKMNLEYLFIKFLEKRSTNSICFIQSSDQFKCQQKLILLSRCSRLTANIDSNIEVLPRKALKKATNQFGIYPLLAIRKHLYTIPIFLETCLPNNSLKTLKTEYHPCSLEKKSQDNLLKNTNSILILKDKVVESINNNNILKKPNDLYDIFVCMLRVEFVEIINQLKFKNKIENKYPSIYEIKQLWLDKFGIEADILYLLQIAGLNDKYNAIDGNTTTSSSKMNTSFNQNNN
ncbi:hypothetical protein FG386_003540 [Cryptosporidium ryanae]|uniref:uncharacterized protein n=1 Tax=Cryptosporidium ryanae TaxID=515981 RepID=UPI00351A8264|nr:hypothetical protein FG386_003540 [Cryptosporidium ryanae]